MTIITKPLSEKKIQKEPLVGDTNATAPPIDEESGGIPLIVTMRSRAHRVNNLTTVCVLITALLVLSTGIVGGVYLYRQFIHYRMKHFRGWCSIPLSQRTFHDFDDVHDVNFHKPQIESDPISSSLLGTDETDFREHESEHQEIKESDSDSINQGTMKIFDLFEKASKLMENFRKEKDSFNEEFDIDLENEHYERIEVPDFSHGRRGRFVHDFVVNKTAILDIENHRCFVMPLNRTLTLKPKDLFDMLTKMRQGYYDVDTDIVRQRYRVKIPPIDDRQSVGYYISLECKNFPIFELEQMISSPVYKRSVDVNNDVVFAEFAGHKISEIEIVNIQDTKSYK